MGIKILIYKRSRKRTTQLKEQYAECPILMVFSREKGSPLLKESSFLRVYNSLSGKMMPAKLSVPHWRAALSICL